MPAVLLIAALSVLPASALNLADATRGAQILSSRHCFNCHDFAGGAGRVVTGPLAKFRRTQMRPAQLVGAVWSHLPTMWAAAGSQYSLGQWTEQDASDVIAWFAAAGYFEPAGDARKGAITFESQGCSVCHQPGTEQNQLLSAAEREKLTVDKWTTLNDPVSLLHAIWRHAPSMKAAMDHNSMNWPSLTAPELADIMAFAFTRASAQAGGVRLVLGDPEKGKTIYQMKGCVGCHATMKPEREARLLHSLTELTAVFWNHAPMMTSLPASLSNEEIADVVAYLWASRYFEAEGSAVRGRSVYTRKRCDACHADPGKLRDTSAVAMLAAAWRHPASVIQQARERRIQWPRFEGKEMADLLAWLSSLAR